MRLLAFVFCLLSTTCFADFQSVNQLALQLGLQNNTSRTGDWMQDSLAVGLHELNSSPFSKQEDIVRLKAAAIQSIISPSTCEALHLNSAASSPSGILSVVAKKSPSTVSELIQPALAAALHSSGVEPVAKVFSVAVSVIPKNNDAPTHVADTSFKVFSAVAAANMGDFNFIKTLTASLVVSVESAFMIIPSSGSAASSPVALAIVSGAIKALPTQGSAIAQGFLLGSFKRYSFMGGALSQSQYNALNDADITAILLRTGLPSMTSFIDKPFPVTSGTLPLIKPVRQFATPFDINSLVSAPSSARRQ